MIVMKLVDVKSKPDEFVYIYNTSDFEMKSEGENYYVSGFISTEVVDENGDVVNQRTLLDKLVDETNPYAKYLSYKHKWLKGDKEDFSNVLGVLQRAEIKENPISKRPGVWAEYMLLKTSPYFDSALYDIKNKGVSGFSIEFKEPKRRPISIGAKFASFLEDYVFGGVGIVARAAVKSAIVDGFYLKEYETISGGDEEMDIKEENVKAPETSVEDTKVEEPKVEPPVPELPETNEELDDMKKELDAQKLELEKLKIKQEQERIKQELESLKAKATVLTEVGEHKLEDQEVPTMTNTKESMVKDVEKIWNEDSGSIKDKLEKIVKKTFI